MPFEEQRLPRYEHLADNTGCFTVDGFFFTRGVDGSSPRGVRIVITPGYAFGFDHPATELVLETLSGLSNVFRGGKALDIGAGTGILSVYLAKKGAGKVTGIEIDPVAASEAQKNLRRNGIKRKHATCKLKDVDLLRKKYPFIVANVPLNVHEFVASRVKKLLDNGGTFVAGGIMMSQLEKANELYAGIVPVNISSKADWVAITYNKYK